MKNIYSILLFGFLALSGLGFYFALIEGDWVFAAWLMAAAIGLGLPIPVEGFPSIKPFGLMAIFCYIYGGIMLLIGGLALASAWEPPYSVFGPELSSSWPIRTNADTLSPKQPSWDKLKSPSYKGAKAIHIPGHQSALTTLFYHHFYPVNLKRFPAKYIDLLVDSSSATNAGVTLTLATSRDQLTPKDGIRFNDWVKEEANGSDCVLIRVPINEFNLQGDKFWGIHIRSESNTPVTIAEVRLTQD